jgi:hypothetical protein
MRKIAPVLIMLAVLAGGSYLRLVRLDYPTMGSDVMVYYGICQSGASPGELMVNSPKHIGDLPPLWFAAHNAFLQWLNLEVNYRNARLPDALIGILTLLAVYGAGRAAGDRRTGLLAALFVAIQPLHVQMSRECYFYAPIVLGGFLAIWAFLHLASAQENGRPPGPAFYALAFSGFLLLTNIQISSWNFAAIFALALYALLLPPAFRGAASWRPVIWMTLGFFVIGVPTLLSDWGMRDAIVSLFGERKDYWHNIFGDRLGNPWLDSGRILLAYVGGSGGLRLAASVFCLAAGIGALAVRWRTDRQRRLLGLFAAGAIVLLIALHMTSSYPMENRHYANLFPLLAILATLGLVHWSDWLLARIRKPGAGALGAVFILGLNAYPAWLSTHLDWEPPYAKVAKWADENLPAGTIVQCDRWYTPWNEFRVNASSNVQYTFTVPNEPIQTYTGSRWRETAKEFIANNPLAAYFENKTYWTRLGPWKWPHDQFARRQDFADETAARLDKMGLFYRTRQLAFPRDWIPVTIFYNTEDDLVARARNAGQRLLCLFGSGWEYTKTQDYRDWYALRQTATATLHNLTPEPLRAHLEVRGAAVNSPVTLTADSASNTVFPANQFWTNRLGPLTLHPGRNEIRLENLSGPQPPGVLLVQRISAREN